MKAASKLHVCHDRVVAVMLAWLQRQRPPQLFIIQKGILLRVHTQKIRKHCLERND